MRAKKSLGQHFLRSEKALSAILDASDPNSLDVILEIGPGEGVLTDKLLKFAGKVVAVEKDDELYEELRIKYEKEIKEGKLDLIHGDILDFDPNTIKFYKDFTYKLVANIPYNITGAILKKFLSAEYQPEIMVLLVQREVAKRIIAGMSIPGIDRRGKESVLSISVKAYGKPRYVDTVKAGSFVPAPKVDSAVLAIEGISRDFFLKMNEERFFEMVKTGFGSKRKKLVSNLGNIFDKEMVKIAFSDLGLDENTRAEDVGIEIWQNLAINLETKGP